MNRLKLTQGGDDCQCAACWEGFVNVEAFDRHRIGRYKRPSTRRCLDKEGMHRAGMVKDEGFWRLWSPPAKDPTISA